MHDTVNFNVIKGIFFYSFCESSLFHFLPLHLVLMPLIKINDSFSRCVHREASTSRTLAPFVRLFARLSVYSPHPRSDLLRRAAVTESPYSCTVGRRTYPLRLRAHTAAVIYYPLLTIPRTRYAPVRRTLSLSFLTVFRSLRRHCISLAHCISSVRQASIKTKRERCRKLSVAPFRPLQSAQRRSFWCDKAHRSLHSALFGS